MYCIDLVMLMNRESQNFGQNKASQCDLPVRPLKDDSIMYVHIFYTYI